MPGPPPEHPHLQLIKASKRPARKPGVASIGEGTSKARGAALLSVNIAPQQRFVSGKCLLVSPLRRREFTCEHVGRNHCQRRTLPRQQRHAESGIT